MMKRLLPILMAAFVSFSITAQISTFPWDEGFEGDTFPPQGWTSYNVDGENPEWQKASYNFHTGDGAAMHNYSFSSNQEGWLVTPQIAVPADASADFSLTFYSRLGNGDTNYYDYNGVWISTAGSDPATGAFTEIMKLDASESYVKITLSLASYAGQNIYIGFVYKGYNAHQWFIDDVKVADMSNFVDVEVVSITAPNSGRNLAHEHVKAVVKNNGSAAAVDVSVTLKINGTEVVTETIPVIEPLSQIEYTFTQTADLTAGGDFAIEVTAALEGDLIEANNSASKTINNLLCPIITDFPWEENFDDGISACWGNIANGNDPYNKWQPSVFNDNNVAISISYYEYGGIGWAFIPDNWLITPPIAIDGDTYSLTYKVGSTHSVKYEEHYSVLVSTSGGDIDNFTEIYSETLSSGTMKTVALSLEEYEGETIYIAFRHWDCTDQRVLVLDDLRISDISQVIDVEVVSVTSPVSGINLGFESVTAIIQNNSVEDITDFTLTLNVNGTDVATETYQGTIAPIGQAEYTFAQTADLSAAGEYIIKVSAQLDHDQVEGNNAAETTVSNLVCEQITTLPWFEGFDNGIPECWRNIDVDDDRNAWYATTADDEPIVVSGSWYYGPLTPDNWLITPQIVIPELSLLQFSVDAWYSSAPAEKYSVLVSTTGANIEDFTEIYTETLDDRVGIEMKTVTLPLDQYIGETIYIAFRHWDCTNQRSLMLDNVTVFDFTGIVDAEIAEITEPRRAGGFTDAENVSIMIKNKGSEPITGFTLKLEVDGVEIATETYTGSIGLLGQAEYTFNQTVDLSELGSYDIRVTVNLNNDQVAENNSMSKTIVHVPNITLYGVRVYDDVISGEEVVSFDSNNSDDVTRVSNYRDGSNYICGGEFYDGTLYLFSHIAAGDPANFIKLSTETWTVVTTPISSYCYDMAYDYTTGTMYGFGGQGDSELFTVNLENGEMTVVGPMEEKYAAMACNFDGELFAIDENGNFCAIDKMTGTPTVIASTGIIPAFIQSMAFDHNSGRLFWAMTNQTDGRLIEIDPATGAVLDMGIIGNNSEIVALYTPYYIKEEIDIVELTPADKSVEQELNASVAVTFSADVTASDLSGITISPNPGNVNASVSGAVLTIAHDDFVYETTYTVTVPAGAIEDYDKAISWSFTTKKGVGISSSASNTIEMYPNPASDKITLTNLSDNSRVTIFDQAGRLLKAIDASSTEIIDIDFSPGVYIVKIESEERTVMKKLIVK